MKLTDNDPNAIWALNLSSALANIQQQVATETDIALLRTTICPQPEVAMINATKAAIRSENHQNQLPLTKLLNGHFLEPAKSFDSSLEYIFSGFWTENGDQRANRLPFISSGPWKLICATLLYLYLIKSLLPEVMRRRKAMELNWTIRSYNLLMVLSNFYAFYHGARIFKFGIKCFGCEVIDSEDESPQAMELLHYGWLFLISRLVEWLDTIFFVLRKRDRQVTKLHVFHHSFVPMLSWIYLKFHPGYTVAFFPFVNTFVHTIMYSYYFLATFGPKVQPYLWWKRHLTSLQIGQFVLILIQLASIPLSISDQCQYPRGFLAVAIAGAFLFLWLFYTYYLDTYKRQQPSATGSRVEGAKQQSSYNKQQHATSNCNGNQREGSSQSLWTSIENVIEETTVNNSAKGRSKKVD